ncbi:segregation/condensation protein A [Candidatus Woesearchaeota archaeon]|nr:segregation/condensation protein A [Candidatus Woesearchaeota archaeon]
MEDRIMQIVLGKESNEVTWRSMIYELVKSEQMDPWDVNVSVLAKRYVQMLKKLKELDFRVSGKMVLAASILLKIKSNLLVGEEMAELDRLMTPQDEESAYEGFYEELDSYGKQGYEDYSAHPLLPRTPQPRKRKVSIYDLVISLQKALEVRDRRVARRMPHVTMEVPRRKTDMGKLIGEVYDKVTSMFKASRKLTFTQLLPKDATKEAKILTFMPLLHLANVDYRKLDLLQQENFGEIDIILREGLGTEQGSNTSLNNSGSEENSVK